MARFDLTDREWAMISPLLPNKPRGVARVDDRRVLDAIFYALRTGSPWRDLPERYGPYTTADNRYNRWAKAGVWLGVFEALAARSPQSLQLIDSSIIRAHQHAAGGKNGAPDHAVRRSLGGLSTKINALVDGSGLPIALSVAPGRASDKAAVPGLLARIAPGRNLVADRGYDAPAILDMVAARGGHAHIPTKRDRKIQCAVSPELHRAQNLVERFFNMPKQFRRIATRFDKPPKLPRRPPSRLSTPLGTPLLVHDLVPDLRLIRWRLAVLR